MNKDSDHGDGRMLDRAIEEYLLSRLQTDDHSYTVTDLVRAARAAIGADRQAVRRAVHGLLAAGALCYCQRFGRTVVEIAYHSGRYVSSRILLAGEHFRLPKNAPVEKIVVRIAAGAAFGAGDHPSTRLILQAIDALFANRQLCNDPRVLDIGTGSGVLAIAAVLCGAAVAVGLDIDPCAIWEARHNATINGLEDRVRILDAPLESLDGRFDLILANLRMPTLIRLARQIDRLLAPDGALVVSGIRPEEQAVLVKSYGAMGAAPVWQATTQGWSAMVLRAGGGGPEKDQSSLRGA